MGIMLHLLEFRVIILNRLHYHIQSEVTLNMMTCTGHALFIISTVYENKYILGNAYVNNSEQILLPLYYLCVKLFHSHRLSLCVCVYIRCSL